MVSKRLAEFWSLAVKELLAGARAVSVTQTFK
jgi:hypothetical protein